MNRMIRCVTALAAIALPMPATAATAIANDAIGHAVPIHDLAHIRTALHGQRGPVIVLIPGMSTPAAVWDDTVTKLSANHRLLVVEVKGFGGSRVPANEQPGLMDGIIADLVADLHAHGIKHATLVGHSFGGLLSLKLALEHPAMAERLLIVDALPFFGTIFDPSATVESTKPRAESMRQMIILNADNMRKLGAQAVTDGSRAAGMSIDEGRRIKIASWSTKAEPLVVAQAIYEDFLTDYRRQIGRITVPVTVLYQDGNNYGGNPDRYKTDYAALPQAKLVAVSGAAHFIQLDRPDIFLAELHKLLIGR